MRFADPESQALLGRVRSIEVSRTSGLWSVKLIGPELEGRQVASSWKMVHDWFMCRPLNHWSATRITSQDLRIRDVAHEQGLADIEIEVHPQTERTLMSAQFRLPSDQADAKPMLLRISRYHHERQLATNLRLETGPTALPCSLIAPLFPEFKALGEQAAVVGNISLQRRHRTWEIGLENAYLIRVDFGQLNTGVEKRIAGTGWVFCERGVITDSGLQYMAGGIGIERGRIDERLLSASQRYLGVTLPSEVQVAQVRLHSFEQLQITFEISPQRLRFVGLVQKSADGTRSFQPGTIIADAAGELAMRVSDEPVPLQNVLALLSDMPEVTTAAAQLSPNLVPVGWLAQQAAWWLPLRASPPPDQPALPETDDNNAVRLSRTPQ